MVLLSDLAGARVICATVKIPYRIWPAAERAGGFLHGTDNPLLLKFLTLVLDQLANVSRPRGRAELETWSPDTRANYPRGTENSLSGSGRPPSTPEVCRTVRQTPCCSNSACLLSAAQVQKQNWNMVRTRPASGQGFATDHNLSQPVKGLFSADGELGLLCSPA